MNKDPKSFQVKAYLYSALCLLMLLISSCISNMTFDSPYKSSTALTFLIFALLAGFFSGSNFSYAMEARKQQYYKEYREYLAEREQHLNCNDDSSNRHDTRED